VGILLIAAIGLVGLAGVLAQGRRVSTTGLAEQRQALFRRLSADPELVQPGTRDRLSGFTLGRPSASGDLAPEVHQHLMGLVSRSVRVDARVGGMQRFGRFVKLQGEERLVFRLEDSAAPLQEARVGVTVSFTYRTLQSGWSLLAELEAIGKRGDWALVPPRTIERRDSRAHQRLPLQGRRLTVLMAGELSAEELAVVDLSEQGLGILYRPGQLRLQPGDEHPLVLRAYGERFADLTLAVRNLSEVRTGVLRAGLQARDGDDDARSVLRQICMAARRAGRVSATDQ